MILIEYKKICPRCNKTIIGYPAISRTDNKTEICSNCGIIEALEVFINAKCKGDEENSNEDNKGTG